MADLSLTQLLESGNAYYKDGHYEQARENYTKAIQQIIDTLYENKSMESQLYSNRAQTFIQERNFAAALKDTNKARELDSRNEKAAVRQLIALENLERLDSALELANDLLQTFTNQTSLFEFVLQTRRRLRVNVQRDKIAAKKERGQLAKMVHKNQQLRINLNTSSPEIAVFDKPFEIGIVIANEFGLFQRDWVSPDHAMHLKCCLRSVSCEEENQVAIYKFQIMDTSGKMMDKNNLVLNSGGKVNIRVKIYPIDNRPWTEHKLENVALQITGDSKCSRCLWDLLPLVTLPFRVVDESKLDHIQITDTITKLGIHCCRPIKFEGLKTEILLAEAPGSLGIGGKLWDSSLVLAKMLIDKPNLISNKRVVELGSGIGLVGIIAGILGARVILTDIHEVIQLLEFNCNLNFQSMDEASKPIAKPHIWGTPVEDVISSWRSEESKTQLPDVILMSDVVYDPEGYAPLVRSLIGLSTSQTIILMAHRSRNPMEPQFFELLHKNFTSEQMDWNYKLQEGSERRDATSSQQELQDVKLFSFKKRATV